MSSLIKFKTVNVYGRYSNNLYDKSKFYEFKCDPSYNGDIILLCNKSMVTFDKLINLLLRTMNTTNILGVVSLIYYRYSDEFLHYLKKCSSKEYKKIKRKCRKKFKSLNSFIERSDDLLYPQNVIIRKIHQLFEDK